MTSIEGNTSDAGSCRLAVQRCLDAGINHFFLAPGSRCTPLTLAVASHGSARIVQHFDERGLVYAAVGYARATGRPGVFVCTSGTAVANALPAVVEAAMEGVPLLLWTADRPPELRGTGANQTIDQVEIFGKYVRWFCDVPCPTPSPGGIPEQAFVSSLVRRAITCSATGPVHLNWMFREPFSLERTSSSPTPIGHETSDATEPTELRSPKSARIDVDGNTILVAGGCQAKDSDAIKELAISTGLPLVADVTSGLRGVAPDVLGRLPIPDTIVHLGGRVVSKQYDAWVKALDQTNYVHVSPRDVYINPTHRQQTRICVPLQHVRLQGANNTENFREAWKTAVVRYKTTLKQAFEEIATDTSDVISEPEIAQVIADQIPDGHALFLGNSSPIRDFDRYGYWSTNKNIRVGANRGASGIDGLIATGVGFARGTEQPTTIVIGDLSTLHDLNSLALFRQAQTAVTLVVINNQAGAIFDMLPIAQRTDVFEKYFATPHSWGFQPVAGMFDIPYHAVATRCEFTQRYSKAVTAIEPNQQPTSQIIEVKTDRMRNQSVRRKIQERLSL